MNGKCKFFIVLSLIFLFATLQVQAERYKGPVVKKSSKADAECSKPSKAIDLSLNSVRAYLKSNGTMWFREKAEYEIPKGSGKTSLFSGSLWIGGEDDAGNIRVAAMRFAQDGNDYWTGPLKVDNASIIPASCAYWDKFFPMSRVEVERHINAKRDKDPNYVTPKSIREWPAHGRSAYGESRYLAPYHDVAGDPNTYEPELGDYPYYDFKNELCPWTSVNVMRAMECPWVDIYDSCDAFGTIPNPRGLPLTKERIAFRQNPAYGWDNMQIYADHVLKGDETVFWFLNDRGGKHSESSSLYSIGLEIRVQAFAFATNDELNKMTFYSYEIINRGSNTLNNTYFSQWCDPDLGFAEDDWVGCDILRGLGYCYNGKEIDGSGQIWAYGKYPPAVGLDFFQGPYIDKDGTDSPAFYPTLADIDGTPEQKEYCNRFVKSIFRKWGYEGDDEKVSANWWKHNGPSNLSDTIVVKVGGTDVTVRWNDQFAINGVNFNDGIVDNERFGMRAFVYHNNRETGPKGDPKLAPEHYKLLTGKWKSGAYMYYGGDAYRPTPTSEDVITIFMFPKGTDYCNWGTRGVSPGEAFNGGGRKGNWSEDLDKNEAGDRRFMQSAGPFTLKQGACNYVTVGIPWARASSGNNMDALPLLFAADDKAQALFENCFKIIDGPDAPHLTIREYDRKLIMLLSNPPYSNNANEDYIEEDKTIPDSIRLSTGMVYNDKDYDKNYRFEGYQIYQVKGPEVGAVDLENPNLSRLIKQYDIVNFNDKGEPIGRLINWEFDGELGTSVPREKVGIEGSNSGIEHSFEFTRDAFNGEMLVNYKTYYFIAIAYAYNEYLPFFVDETKPDGLWGNKLPYLRGRKTPEGRSVTPIQGIPHPPTVHGGGLTLYSNYGNIPVITRIDGQGNGGNALEISKETMEKIARGGDNNDYRVRELQYERNAGPLNVKVIDPLRVKPFDYTLVIIDTAMLKHDTIISKNEKNRKDVGNNAIWILTIGQLVTNEELIKAGLFNKDGEGNEIPIREFRSQAGIGQYYEQIIFPLGISIAVKNADFTTKDPLTLKHWDNILFDFKYTDKNKKVIDYYDDNMFRVKFVYLQSEKIEIQNDIVFENGGSEWITGISDDNADLPSNWIRAGNKHFDTWATANTSTPSTRENFFLLRQEDFFFPSKSVCDDHVSGNPLNGQYADRAFKDYEGKFGTLCKGTWAPYVLTSPYDGCPQAKFTEPDFKPGSGFMEPAFSTDNTQDGYGSGEKNYYDIGTGNNQVPPYNGLTEIRLQPGYNQTMTNLYSVNIVLTPDRSLWTRSIVLESCTDPKKAEGGALKNEPRKAKSVGKDGNPDNSKDGFGDKGDEGMGWFPGYAVNIETGERLNIMFSENSDVTLKQFGSLVNGSDMIFNPTSTYAILTQDLQIGNYTYEAGTTFTKSQYDLMYQDPGVGPQRLADWGIERVWGGMHYVYVCNSSGNTCSAFYLINDETITPKLSDFFKLPDKFLKGFKRNFNLNDETLDIAGREWGIKHDGGDCNGYLDKNKKYPYYDCGPYDECRWLVQKFKSLNSIYDFISIKNTKMQLFNNVMYTHIPMQPADPDLQSKWLSCDVTYKIRVTRPYMRYVSRWYDSPEARNKDYSVPDEYVKYQGFPVYKLSTRGMEPTFEDTRVFNSILENINVVPNPYLCFNTYERNALTTMVKITNLPTDLKNNAQITINIYTVSGILVRTLTKGDSETAFVNWDLKNHANIPIASGVYLIHVNCPGIGERVLKFFCTMRQTDLNQF